MTEPIEPAEATTAPPGSVQETPEPSGQGDPPESKKDRYDANVRTERDQLRTQNEALNTRVAAMQKAEIHRRAAEHFHTPADLDLIVTPEKWAECYNDDGSVDEGAVAALFDTIKDERPGWKRRAPAGTADIGFKRTPQVGPSAEEAMAARLSHNRR